MPPSGRSSVESSRTSVDLPEPFWPRMATHSPRSIVKVTPVERRDAAAAEASLLAVAATELLAELVHLDGDVKSMRYGLHECCFLYVGHVMLLRSAA